MSTNDKHEMYLRDTQYLHKASSSHVPTATGAGLLQRPPTKKAAAKAKAQLGCVTKWLVQLPQATGRTRAGKLGRLKIILNDSIPL